MKKEILVVVKMPGARATKMTLNGNDMLHELQGMVSGYIEALPYHDEKFSILVNEEGVINGMPYNCQFDGSKIFGPAVVIKNGYSDFESLSDTEANAFIDKFNGKPASEWPDEYAEVEKDHEKFIEAAMKKDVSFASFILKDLGDTVGFKGASNLPISGHIMVAAAMLEKAAQLMVEKSRRDHGLPDKEAKKLAISIVLSEVRNEIRAFKDGEVL